MKGNQNRPNRQATPNNMTSKPLPFSHRSRSNSREQRNHSRQKSKQNSHKITQNPITETVISNHHIEIVHHNQDQISIIIHDIILDHNQLTLIETEIVHDDRSHEIDFVMLGTLLFHY